MNDMREDVAVLVQRALLAAACAPDGRGNITLPIAAIEALVGLAQLGAPEQQAAHSGTPGERLRLARQRAGITATDLAKRTGVTPSCIVNIENAVNGLRANRAAACARALRVSPQWLLYGVEQ